MITRTEIITPETARKYLEKNTENRPKKEFGIRRYAEAMAAGQWHLTGDSIKFDTEGRVLDGQNRLFACVRANVPFKSLVVYGLNSGAFPFIDKGFPRTSGDDLHCVHETEPKLLAAALKIAESIETGNSTMLKERYGASGVLELLAKHPQMRESVERAGKRTRLIHRSVLVALHYLFAKKSRRLADQFVDQMVTGENLWSGQPFYLLRERLVRNAAMKAKVEQTYLMALAIKAWNATRTEQTLKHLRFRENGPATEAFPEIV